MVQARKLGDALGYQGLYDIYGLYGHYGLYGLYSLSLVSTVSTVFTNGLWVKCIFLCISDTIAYGLLERQSHYRRSMHLGNTLP